MSRSRGKLKYDGGYLENCSEIEVFIQVNQYYELLKKLDYWKKMYQFYKNTEEDGLATYFGNLANTISNEEFQELQDTLDYCLLQTTRFNTEIVDNPNGRIEITPSFETWYQNWNDYIDNMDEESLMLYRRCRYEGKGLEQFQLNQLASIENIEDTLNSPKVKQYYYHERKENIRQKFA